jgi:hypothetical protein
LIQWWWTILLPTLQLAVITQLSLATFTNDGQNHRWRGFWNWWWWTFCSTTIALPILLRNKKENKVVEPWSQLPFGHLSLTICINFFSIKVYGRIFCTTISLNDYSSQGKWSYDTNFRSKFHH